MGKDKNVLYLGNLRRDLHVTELKNNLLDLFCDFIGIEIDWNDIDIRKGKNAWFAFVDLHNEREASETLEELASWENRKNLRYNFLHIVPPLESLAVDYKKVKKVRKNKKDKSKDSSNEPAASGSTSKTVKTENKKDSTAKPGSQKTTNQVKSNSKASKATSDTLASNDQGPADKPNSKDHHDQKDKNTLANQTTDSNTTDPTSANQTQDVSNNANKDKEVLALEMPPTGLPTLQRATATSAMTPTAKQTQSECYVKGQFLGNETRNVEFKLGGGNYHKKILYEHVCKYACGFLNSSEGGQLLIGVTDDGHVSGLNMDRIREDECRLTIDNAMKTINPAVFTDMYKVHFIPVREKEHTGKENLKVIEITFSATESEMLYSTGGDVYIRRDGSIQGPLKGAEIQEWTKKECFQE